MLNKQNRIKKMIIYQNTQKNRSCFYTTVYYSESLIPRTSFGNFNTAQTL